ncbi:hypothetical protein EWM64_g10004 [Hericium alpestre]|uniref:Uncharacterized protein n=1 Tax=Hericium alpestre TaxID=135208 RepID=A0A4Y9ZK35_9AGAM|nr:hypothetical protein EWM64_g10004 [Hericium alpestre]
MNDNLKAFARWEVDYEGRVVRSTVCHRLMANRDSQICNTCGKVAQDPSFKDAVHRKILESRLLPEKQKDILAKRVKFAPYTYRDVEGRYLKKIFKDPLVVDILNHLKRDESTDCFLKLYKYAIDGNLKGHQTFIQICDYGQHYPEDYLNFMTLLRSHGQNSSRQYAIVTVQICGPSSCHLQTLVAKSSDALQNPALVFENMARVKHFVDAVRFFSPISVAGDCTKVHPWLAYSTSFSTRHIIGSTLPLDECAVKDSKDVDKIVDNIKSSKSVASQVRAILAKIPLPIILPVVVVLLPTTGSDTASGIHEHHMLILCMAAQLSLPIVSFAADGAASELAAQVLMDSEKSELPPMVYEHATYGIFIKAIIFPKTGPLVSITDPSHAMKTGHNQPQHSTHNASFGNSCVVNNMLIEVYKTGTAGLQLADVKNVDKQDDGAA